METNLQMLSSDGNVLCENIKNLDYQCTNGCYNKIKLLLRNAVQDRTAITTKENHIKELEIKLAKLEVNVSTYTDKIKDKDDVISALKMSIGFCKNKNSNSNESSSKLEDLKATLKEQNNQLTSLQAKMRDKDMILKETEAKSVCYFNQIQQMKVHLHEYESMIKSTPNAHQHLLVESTQQIAVRDRHIEKLQNVIKSKDAQIVLFELESSHKFNGDVKAQIDEKMSELKEKVELLATKEAMIKEKTKMVADLQLEIEQRDEKFKELEKLLALCKAQLKEKDDKQADKLLKDCKARINGYTNTIKQLRQNLSDSQTSAAETKAENVAHQESIIELKKKLKENENKLADCEAEVKKKSKVQKEETYSPHGEVVKLMSSGWLPIQGRHMQFCSAAFMLNFHYQCLGYNYENKQHWVGLESLHALTNLKRHELYIHIVDFDNLTWYARYDNFVIDSSTQNYKLKSLGKYSGDAGDGMRPHEKMGFSLLQRGRDKSNCIFSSWWHTKPEEFENSCDLNAIKMPRYRTSIWWMGELRKSVTMLLKAFEV